MKYKDLPIQLRDWLGSDQVTSIIGELNDNLLVFGQERKILPSLIKQLIQKEIPPQNFAKAIKNKLFISQEEANKAAEVIKNRILRPIELQLREEVGLNIQEISSAPDGQQPQSAQQPKPDHKFEQSSQLSADQSGGQKINSHQAPKQMFKVPVDVGLFDSNEYKQEQKKPGQPLKVHYHENVSDIDH